MLDTIILTLDRHQFQISEPELFQPSARTLIDPNGHPISGQYARCTQNIHRRDRRNKPYGPRLTLSRRHCGSSYDLMLKIEFSAPKLLLGNNFEELSEKDLPELISTLRAKLLSMGVKVTIDVLNSARVSAIHYSKNIVLTDGGTATYYIGKLQRLNIPKRLDVARTVFRNEGHGFSIHANSYEIVFYDKLSDLSQAKISEKRSFEKDNENQMRILNAKTSSTPFEVLRMEVRLGTRPKIKDILRKIDEKCIVIFSDLFNGQISKAILSYFIKFVLKGENQLSSYRAEDVRKLLTALTITESTMTFGRVLQICGLHHILADMNFRELRAFFPKVNKRTVARYERILRELNLSTRRIGSFAVIEKAISTMEPVSFSKLTEIQKAILKLKILKNKENT